MLPEYDNGRPPRISNINGRIKKKVNLEYTY